MAMDWEKLRRWWRLGDSVVASRLRRELEQMSSGQRIAFLDRVETWVEEEGDVGNLGVFGIQKILAGCAHPGNELVRRLAHTHHPALLEVLVANPTLQARQVEWLARLGIRMTRGLVSQDLEEFPSLGTYISLSPQQDQTLTQRRGRQLLRLLSSRARPFPAEVRCQMLEHIEQMYEAGEGDLMMAHWLLRTPSSTSQDLDELLEVWPAPEVELWGEILLHPAACPRHQIQAIEALRPGDKRMQSFLRAQRQALAPEVEEALFTSSLPAHLSSYLDRLEDRRWLEALCRYLSEAPDPALDYLGERDLQEFSSHQLQKFAEPVLHHPDQAVRTRAVRVLGQAGS